MVESVFHFCAIQNNQSGNRCWAAVTEIGLTNQACISKSYCLRVSVLLVVFYRYWEKESEYCKYSLPFYHWWRTKPIPIYKRQYEFLQQFYIPFNSTSTKSCEIDSDSTTIARWNREVCKQWRPLHHYRWKVSKSAVNCCCFLNMDAFSI